MRISKLSILLALLLALLSPISASAVVRCWVGGSGSWNDTAHWSATCNTAGGSSVPGSGDDATIDGTAGGLNGETLTVDLNFSVISLTTATMVGTLDFATNTISPTFGANGWSNNGSSVRAVNWGTGTFTFNGTNTAGGLNNSTLTNYTATGTPTLVFNGNSTSGRVIGIGGGFTPASISIAGNSSGGSWTIIPSGAPTITALSISPPNTIAIGGAFTLTNAAAWTGTASNPINLVSNSLDTAQTIALSNIGVGVWMSIRGITFATSAFNATNTLNLGKVTTTGSITPPSSGGVCPGRFIGG